MNTMDALATDRQTYNIVAQVIAEVAVANPEMTPIAAVHLAGHLFFTLRAATAMVVAPAVAMKASPVSRKSNTKVKTARKIAPVAIKPPVVAVVNHKPLLALRSTDDPAVPVNMSLNDDFVVCLEDGTKHIMMKRHLRRYGLTAGQYLKRWNLPEGYPLVAPNYSRKKFEEARHNRLGSKENKSGMKATEIAAMEASLELAAAE